MHIVMVTSFPESPRNIDGGVAGVARYLVEELKKQPGVKLSIVVPKGTVGQTACEQWEDFDVYKVGKRGLLSFLPGTVYDIFAGRRQLKDVLERLNPDVVHFQGVTFLAANCSWPNVLTIHGIAEQDAKWDSRWGVLRWLKWLILKLTEDYGRRRIPNVILISEYTKKFLPENSINRRTWFIDNPVADSFFEVERRAEKGRIFCCSRIRPLKNILGMIEAFTLIARDFPGASLRIAGTADNVTYFQKCKEKIETHNMHNNVHLLGNISIKDVQSELSKASCLVVPSFQENAPLTIAEAMAAGVPVVAAKVGGVPEMVEHEETGLLIDPYDTKSLTEAVSRIISDESLARSMGHRAKEIAGKRFAASVVAEKTLNVYREVLKGHL
jgi:glycosyltransferase involved in cell wall biosynthesis